MLKAITDKDAAFADQAFEITNAVKEAKVGERQHFNDLLNKEKAKALKLKTTGDAEMQRITVSRYRRSRPFSMTLNAHSSSTLYPFYIIFPGGSPRREQEDRRSPNRVASYVNSTTERKRDCCDFCSSSHGNGAYQSMLRRPSIGREQQDRRSPNKIASYGEVTSERERDCCCFCSSSHGNRAYQ